MDQIDQSFVSVNEFKDHLFIKTCFFEDYLSIYNKIQLARTNNDVGLALTNIEHYCFECGNQLTHIMSDIESLHHSLLYLHSFEPTEKMKKHLITKNIYTKYISDYYKILFISIYDKSLQIVNYVYRFGLKKNNVSHLTIVKKLEKHDVTISNILGLREKTNIYRDERHAIIHRDTSKDIELASLTLQDISGNNSMRTNDYVTKKISEYYHSNQQLWRALSDLFDSLLPVYKMKKVDME